MDRPCAFNNAGVLALGNGHLAVAIELFGGALDATKVLVERSSRLRSLEPTDTANKAATMPESIRRAEDHLSNFSLYINQVVDDFSDIEREESSGGFYPYYFVHPFRFPTTYSEHLSSAMIVFNLALACHHRSRRSPRAASLYSCAARTVLLDEAPSEPSAPLLLAILNNYYVLCYESQQRRLDYEANLLSSLELARLVDRLSSMGEIDRGVEIGVRANIEWLATHPSRASPAA